MDHYQSVEGQNLRKSIFIFLGNTGRRDIAKETLKFWTEGKKREDITYRAYLVYLIQNVSGNTG
jgi:hypothetical protein